MVEYLCREGVGINTQEQRQHTPMKLFEYTRWDEMPPGTYRHQRHHHHSKRQKEVKLYLLLAVARHRLHGSVLFETHSSTQKGRLREKLTRSLAGLGCGK